MVGSVGVKALEVQLGNDGVQQPVDAGPAGVKHIVRSFFVQGIARLVKAAQFFQGVIHLQQRSLHIVFETAKNLFRRRSQVNHLAARTQVLPIGLAQNGAPPVDKTPWWCLLKSSMTLCSMSRKRSSPSRSKNSRIEHPRRCSMTLSESKKGRPRRRPICLPMVVLPDPGRPTKIMSKRRN